MQATTTSKQPNAWIAINSGLSSDSVFAPYTLLLRGERSLYQTVADGDWLLILSPVGHITRVGRVLRIRSDLETATIYFDRMLLVDPVVSIGLTSLTPPSSGSVGRIQWTDFLESLPKALHKTIAEVPTIEDQAYIRELTATSRDGRLARPGRRPQRTHRRHEGAGALPNWQTGPTQGRTRDWKGHIHGGHGSQANNGTPYSPT